MEFWARLGGRDLEKPDRVAFREGRDPGEALCIEGREGRDPGRTLRIEGRAGRDLSYATVASGFTWSSRGTMARVERSSVVASLISIAYIFLQPPCTAIQRTEQTCPSRKCGSYISIGAGSGLRVRSCFAMRPASSSGVTRPPEIKSFAASSGDMSSGTIFSRGVKIRKPAVGTGVGGRKTQTIS